MRFLPLQRQILIMVRLGHRSDAFDDRLPVLAFVLAVKDIAVRGAGENSVPAVPDIHRHTLDVSADVIGQAAAEKVPSLAAVTARRAPPADTTIAKSLGHNFGQFLTFTGSTLIDVMIGMRPTPLDPLTRTIGPDGEKQPRASLKTKRGE